MWYHHGLKKVYSENATLNSPLGARCSTSLEITRLAQSYAKDNMQVGNTDVRMV